MSMLSFEGRELKRIEALADEIINFENRIDILSDEDLANKSSLLKERVHKGESVENILVEAFAVCREITFRVFNKKQYKVQIMGGIAIHEGRVVEMKTGEGKTLTELCPAYLNALTGKGVHIITVNDYLAKRDKEEMEVLFKKLNISVGLVIEETKDRKEEYRKDIIYTTNAEVGFDYLRDNLVGEMEEKVQRGLNYAIIDEIDSIFIDEARTPLLISAKGTEPSNLYSRVVNSIRTLNEDDYIIDSETDSIYLVDRGVHKMELLFNVKMLADTNLSELNHIINQALRAVFLLKKDKDYMVRDGEILLIDQISGRVSSDRRLSNGLHQCLEAKEGVEIKPESKTIGTITYQNLFGMYKKVSGMSGTVKSEEEEFKEIYNLDVIKIPTNKEIQRVDNKDLIYKTKKKKFATIIYDIIKTHETGRPVLIGTLSVEDSEILSRALNNRNIKHNLLNAKNEEKESFIISKAGERNAITIATSMAGRGTDIKISNQVNDLGGLKVIGVERAESRRIDNQLIGRAGRQGNRGSSQFYVSMEDAILNKTNYKDLSKVYKKYGKNRLQRFVTHAQKVEQEKAYQSRRDNFKYNEMINIHRNILYRERDEILSKKNIGLTITQMLLDVNTNLITDIFNKHYDNKKLAKIDKAKFYDEVLDVLSRKYNYSFRDCCDIEQMNSFNNIAQVIEFLTNQLIEYFNTLVANDVIDFEQNVRRNLLIVIDENWVKHLRNMEILKQRVKNEAYNQKDPVQVYKKDSLDIYRDLLLSIKVDFIDALFAIIIPSMKNELGNVI
ncbi:MAG: preprotein translocase subunit SecA [Sarcina sp.]